MWHNPNIYGLKSTMLYISMSIDDNSLDVAFHYNEFNRKNNASLLSQTIHVPNIEDFGSI
jgi:hypothetical protein